MLLKELEYVPLAITQAAAYIKRNKIATLKYYMGKLSQFHLEVKDVLSKELRDPRRHGGSANAVFRTWQISYMQIKRDNTRAADILSLISILDSQAVPEILLHEDNNNQEIDIETIQVLLDFSLIKGDEHYKVFSMHPLQQLVSIHIVRVNNWKKSKEQDIL
jgi:hypothetical protein